MNKIICLICIGMLFMQEICAQEVNKHTPTLIVKGSATLSRPADELSINIGVVTQGDSAGSALEENNSKMNNMIKALQKGGLGKGEYKTGRFNIRPVYSQRPQKVLVDRSPEIVGYEVANSLEVKTEKMDIVGELIDQVTRAGANSVDNITFGIKDPRKYRSEAIAAATQNALKDARYLSDAAGVSLVKIKSLSLDNAETISPLPRGQLYMKSMSAESVPIEAGEVEIHSSVTVEYEIK